MDLPPTLILTGPSVQDFLSFLFPLCIPKSEINSQENGKILSRLLVAQLVKRPVLTTCDKTSINISHYLKR